MSVHFSRAGARLNVLSLQGARVAHCDADCSLLLPLGRYDLRVSGEGPSERARLDLNRATSVDIQLGNSGAFAAGAATGLVGSVAAFALPVAMGRALVCSESEHPSPSDSRSCNQTTLLIVGLSGLALTILGKFVVLGNATQIHINRPPAPAPASVLTNADGIGFRF
jgi:hypothetical protein